MFYVRTNSTTLFLLPTVACGVDQLDGRYFFEIGFLYWAIGIGDAP